MSYGDNSHDRLSVLFDTNTTIDHSLQNILTMAMNSKLKLITWNEHQRYGSHGALLQGAERMYSIVARRPAKKTSYGTLQPMLPRKASARSAFQAAAAAQL